MIAESQGDVATASAMYQKVLAKDPQNFGAIAGMQRVGTAQSGHPGTSAAPNGSSAPAASPSTGANP
jgi:hypothetical protein